MDLPSPHTVHATADPFGERLAHRFVLHRQVLGGRFRFESESEALLQLVESAYGRLPGHRLPGGGAPFHVALRLGAMRAVRPAAPPPVQVHSGAGLLCGVMDECNYVTLDPHGRRALVVASRDMLAHPYHLRYELIEFAVFTLATRGLGLVPLHGACVGRAGRGVLLLGESGSGKSTLALHSLLCGLDFLAEDAVFVRPDPLLATGVPNFLHVRPEALRFVDDMHVRDWIGRAPLIRRRSGVEKREADLRHGRWPLADAPLELAAAVFVSPRPAAAGTALLARLPAEEAVTRLFASQPYAAGQPGWHHFVQQLTWRGVYELRRGTHPRASVEALQALLTDAPAAVGVGG
ncbi:serine kinase [Fulvimonas yonginensis]|uniref:Serine kinase n=2 Tax=Fulvimonas yonginensis TaxID=1495200 RepID=A0ABU8JBV9_9GAMM